MSKGALVTWRGCADPETPVEDIKQYPGVYIESEKLILYLVGTRDNNWLLLPHRFTDDDHGRIITLGSGVEIPYPIVTAGNAYLDAGENLRHAKLEFAALIGHF